MLFSTVSPFFSFCLLFLFCYFYCLLLSFHLLSFFLSFLVPQNLQVVSLPFTCYSPFPLFSCHIFLFCYFYCLLLSFQLLSFFLSFLVLQNLQVVSLPFTSSHPFPFFIVVSSFFLLLLSSFKFPSVLFLPLFSGASKPSSSRRCWLLPGRGVTQVPKKYIYTDTAPGGGSVH